MAQVRALIWLVIIISNLPGYFCENYSDVQTLIDDLLQGYSTYLVPKKNQQETIKVEMEFSLKALNKFDVVDGKLTVVAAITLKWRDDLIVWNPRPNKNISDLYLPLSRVWSPNLYLMNCAEEFLIYKGNPDTKEVEFSSQGNTRLFFMGILTTTCTSDATFYPNDLHHCQIYFSTLMSASKLRMELPSVDTLNFETNGEWILSNLTPGVEFMESKNTDRVIVSVTLQRRMLFHMITIVTPVVFLGLINVVVFKLPVDSGERMSFAMTVLLSFAVYMTLIADKMPQTSNTTPVFCIYLMVMLVSSTFITFVTTYSIICHHTKNNVIRPSFNQLSKLCSNDEKHLLGKPPPPPEVDSDNLSSSGISVTPRDSPSTKKEGPKHVDKTMKRIDKSSFLLFSLIYIVSTALLFWIILGR